MLDIGGPAGTEQSYCEGVAIFWDVVYAVCNLVFDIMGYVCNGGGICGSNSQLKICTFDDLSEAKMS